MEYLIKFNKSKIIYLPALEEGDMTRRQPDVSKMKMLLNRPTKALEEGLKIVIENNRFII